MMKSKTDMRACTRRSAGIIQTRSIKVVIMCMFLYSITPIYGATPWLHVDGNKIKDPSGNEVVLRGAALVDLGHIELWRDGVTTMIDRLTDETDTQGSSPGWYTRVVRLAVYPSDQPDFYSPWFFDDNPDDYYNNLLRPVVDYCASKGLYVIIDWHYIANTGDHVTSTSQFWDYIAPKFAGDSHVLFELFNEPMDSSWSAVKPNMQTWIDIVRSHAPNNLILVGGPRWCQILQPQVNDPVVGDNIVYIAHLYPAHWYGGVWQINVDAIANCAAVHPVMMTEWGFSMSMGSSTLLNGTITEYGQPLMDFLELHGIGNTAWCADNSWGPPMFWDDWTLRCGEDEMGCFVKDTLYLRRNDDQPADNTIYVDADANGLNDGSSWENAYNFLQDALDTAPGGAEIRVAEGIYKPDRDLAHPDGSGERDATFLLKNYMTIKGGYAGFGQPDPNERDIKTYEAILSGDLDGNDVDVNDPCDLLTEPTRAENSYHVVTGNGTDETAVLDGFTIISGNANGIYGDRDKGGGIFNIGGKPTITNCFLSGNSAEGGGGVYNRGSSSAVTNCTFKKNSAKERGGGIYNQLGPPIIMNCTFSDNYAGLVGGGMYNFEPFGLIVNKCIFKGNRSNTGGGMFNSHVNYIMVANCTFSGNSAADSGGGICMSTFSYPQIINCVFNGNSAKRLGGVMCILLGSKPTITNCTFSGNSADQGGVFYCSDFTSYHSNLTLRNCILYGNSAVFGQQVYLDESSASISYSAIDGGQPDIYLHGSCSVDWGDGNIDVDPCFANPDSNDFHLLPNSPCIDAGDNTAVPAGVTTDLDGNPRIRGPAVDMGAYESPAVIFIDVDAAGANNGSSWDDAYNHLQDALSVEWLVDEIRVAEGVYKPDEDTVHPDGSGDRAATFQLKTGVVIKGGYAGYGESDPDARYIGLYETILSGDLNGNDGPDFANNGENSFHVVTDSGTGETAVLDGFTITAGNANGPDEAAQNMGGGMLNVQSKSTLTNCTFIGNSAEYSGGMFNYNGNPTLTNCTFSGNSAQQGGGMFNYYNSSPTLTNCIFNGNSSDIGGGMLNYLSNSTLTNCTFNGNSAGYGGGMYNESSDPMFTNCSFSGNSADYGGGMFNYLSNLTLTNCTLSGNQAEWDGGGMWNYESSPTLTNCTLSGNQAEWDGGGMWNSESSPTLTNCILWGNTATSGAQIYKDGTSLATVSYSDVQGGWPGAGNINFEPCFVEPDSNDYHLLPNSPCIDRGDPSSYFGLEPEPDGGRINMGAYGNTPEATCKGGLVLQSYNLVSKARVDRTEFEYIYTMTLNNNSTEAVSNVVVELLDASENVSIIDLSVGFPYIAAGDSAISDDTFSIIVDRSIPVDATIISWRATFDTAGGGAGQTTFTTGIVLDENASDITGDGEVDFEDLAELARQWLEPPDTPSADISPPGGDGIVNFLDFAKLAENWQGSN